MEHSSATPPAFEGQRQPYLDPCVSCQQSCGERYWTLRRVRGHFCSRDCAKKFAATHVIPRPPCWSCGRAYPKGNWRLRGVRGSRFCSRECAQRYSKEKFAGPESPKTEVSA